LRGLRHCFHQKLFAVADTFGYRPLQFLDFGAAIPARFHVALDLARFARIKLAIDVAQQ
jgi:hypothetical protein